MENREDNVCKLCLKTKVKYTCPRCNIQYCSLECYKSEKHLQCSENFYKECFMEGLKDFGSSKEDKQNVLEMLQRVKDEDPGFDSDDDDEDLEARLQGLDLENDSKTVWNKLTDKEKKEFERLMAGGELSSLVEVWTPWWNDKVLISEIKEKKEKTRIPAVRKDITDISTLLSTGKPSADLKNNVINVLYAYCFICRLYNGDHMSFPTEVTKEVLSVSKVLSGTAVCGSPPEAIQMCFQCLQSRDTENMTSQQFNISLIEDVIRIIQGPSQYDPLQFVMAALSELVLLFHKAMSELTTEFFDQLGMQSDALIGESEVGDELVHSATGGNDSMSKADFEDLKDRLSIYMDSEESDTDEETKELVRKLKAVKKKEKVMKNKKRKVELRQEIEKRMKELEELEELELKGASKPKKEKSGKKVEQSKKGKDKGKSKDTDKGKDKDKDKDSVKDSKDIKKSKEEKARLENKDLKKKVFISLKKLEFLLSWTQRFGMALQSAVTELQLEFCAMSSDLAEVNETKQKVEHFQKEKLLKDNRKLVQEI